MRNLARKINKSTDITVPGGIVVCVPDKAETIFLAQGVADEIRAFNNEVKLLINPEISAIEKGQQVILIGNLADSNIVRDLYFRFLTATDLWYPGKEGYEVRTLLDPYGLGGNIIHLGYSDEKGLQKAIQDFIQRIEGKIDFISEIHPTRLHICESEEIQIRAIKPPELVWMNVARDIYKKGYLGYLTGDKGLIEEYLDMWRAIVSYPVLKDDQKIKDLHLKMSTLIQSFILIETAGLINDEKLRNEIAEYIISWPDTDQGLIRIDVADYMHPEFPRQNHGMIPGLGLAFLINYCKKYKYDIDKIDEWEKLVNKAYHPYMDGSWKPVCDGTCHGWWLSQPALLEYGLIEPEHRYFKNGGARKAAEAAMNLVNNNGVMPASGDFNLLRSFPGISLRHAMAYYRDGRYKFVHDMAPIHLSSKYHVYMPRMFDIGIKSEVPDNSGIKITPMDPLIYNAWEKAPELVEEMLHTGPDVPIEKTFDKLTIRTGWEKADQYLLIDGLGSNSNHTHSYPDALGIIDYYHKGESWLVADNGCKFPENDNLSILTISRVGEEFVIPSFGELLETKADSNHTYAGMRLNNYQKTDWTRKVTLVHDGGLVIRDIVDFKENGEYSITSHLRTPGNANLIDNKMISSRNGMTFVVEAYCSNDFETCRHKNYLSLTYRNHKGEPKPVVPQEDQEIVWENRYHTSDRVITSLDSRVSGMFKKGDKVIFEHHAYVQDSTGMPQVMKQYKQNDLIGKCQKKKVEKPGTPVESNLQIKKVLHNQIHAVDSIGRGNDKKYYVGHGNHFLSCLDNKYNVIWTRTIERDPSYCYWWELDYPSVVELKTFCFAGEDYIVAGCGDLMIRCFNAKGDEKWRFQYINGVPGRINIFDSDGDGIPEILVGGEILSNRSQCRVLGLDGKLKYELDVEFWTSRLTAYDDAGTEEERYVALGANRGRNLFLYRTYFKGDANPVKLFEKKLAGTVDKININIATRQVNIHTSEDSDITYDFKGNMLTTDI